LLNRAHRTLVILGILIEDSQLLSLLLVLFPRRVAVYHVEFSQGLQIVVFQIGLDVDWRVVSFLRPAVLLLHELCHARILDISDGRVDIFDKVLRTFSGFDILSVEAVILSSGLATCLRMRLSLEEYGTLMVALVLFIIISNRD